MSLSAIAFCAMAPPYVVPRFIYSYHLEHFAAFFVLTTAAAAAAQRRGPLGLAARLITFAVATEVARILPPAHRLYRLGNVAADIGGVMTAMGAVAVGEFRTRFARRSMSGVPAGQK